MSQLDLSVVMPLFNSGPWVAEAIQSVLDRADGLLEIIVVDDGSQDDGAAIARSFGGIVHVLEQPNRGPSSARNAGIAQAQGDLVGFHDADDIWVAGSPDPRRSFLSEPGVDLVMARVLPVAGDPLCACHDPIGTSLPAVIARRRVFERFGGLDESLTHGEDLEWLTRVRSAGGRMVSIEDVVVHYRRRPGSLTQDAEATERGVLLAARAALRRRESHAT